MSCSIEVDRTFRPGSTATALRDNETITNGGKSFTLKPTGSPSFGSRVVDQGQQPVAFNLAGTDYGHRLYVTDTGEVVFAKSVEISAPDAAVLRRFSPPTSQPKGTYYLAVEKTSSGEGCLSVYRKSTEVGTADVKIFTPLQEPQSTLERGWTHDDGTYRIVFADDGNLQVQKPAGTFLTGSSQMCGWATPQTITFAADGTMEWLDDNAGVIRTFAGTKGTGPFTLAIDPGVDGRWSLVVKDATGTILYPVFATALHRNWTYDDGTYRIVFDHYGNLQVQKPPGTFLTGSYQACDSATPQTITFAADGTMDWLDDNAGVIRTFAGTKGTGPFTLAIDPGVDGQSSLVVKDATGKNLYPVFPTTRP